MFCLCGYTVIAHMFLNSSLSSCSRLTFYSTVLVSFTSLLSWNVYGHVHTYIICIFVFLGGGGGDGFYVGDAFYVGDSMLVILCW